MTYSEKLKDPRWQKKRLKILERDEFKCVYCSDDKTTLNVHHDSYNGDPWDVEDSELKSVCEDCHKAIHVAELTKQFNGNTILSIEKDCTRNMFMVYYEGYLLFITDLKNKFMLKFSVGELNEIIDKLKPLQNDV